MLTRRKRLLAPVLLTTAGLAVAGCGGGGGGDEDAYVKTLDGACTKINGVQADVQKKIQSQIASAGTDQQKILAAVKSAAGEAFGTISTELKTIADADAPDKWSDFQDSVKKSADPVVKRLDETRTKLENAKTANDLSSLGDGLGNLDLEQTKVPEDLQKRVPACKGLGT